MHKNLKQFSDLLLNKSILTALNKLNYTTPTPIQELAIPYVLEGHDVLGQARTGTGKTAAFALPLLHNLSLKQKLPQVLILVPTRELAIQVADSFKQYAQCFDNFNVATICGGQDYRPQIRQLRKNAQVVVGTPGRIMDHIRRETLKLDELKSLVLDEADEMLRMGFIDDIKWVLEHIPESRQTLLFSATMPKAVKAIAKRYLRDPKEVAVKSKSTTVDTIEQQVVIMQNNEKLQALTRLLEFEAPEAAIVFVRTKALTTELSSELNQQGHQAVALNGDMNQSFREETIKQFKAGKVTLLVATDVAARGLDIERVSHVFNYDVPHEPESYVHRIGRTGRAGRAGKAVLFLSPKEKYLLRNIERQTKQKVSQIKLPSLEDLKQARVHKFKRTLTKTLENTELNVFYKVIDELQREHPETSLRDICAALAANVDDLKSLLFKELKTVSQVKKPRVRRSNADNKGRGRFRERDRRPAAKRTRTNKSRRKEPPRP